MIIDKSAIEKELAKPPEEISIIKLVDAFIEYAFRSRASDIHLDPLEDRMMLRLRIDGVMQNVFSFTKKIQEEIVSRIKVLAGLRIDEHQTAQDGRLRVSLENNKVRFDIRVSIVPTYYGENAVLRLLVEQGRSYTIEDIGLSKGDSEKVYGALKKPYGMILVTGPTGSGKTTTLYTLLKVLHTPEVAIITIEDPIEYSIEGVNQIQVNSQTGLTFASGLRSMLRQDPNIIMVGEIRDEDTANISVNAALTGHLLLSTLHTNDAATTLPRLLDMKIEPFLISSTVNIAIAQRLVRKICPECKVKKQLTAAQLKVLRDGMPENIDIPDGNFFIGKGCSSCNNHGYWGRIGIYEVMEMSDDVRTAITNRASANELKKVIVKNGMTTVLQDGMQKARAGITTIEEVLRVMHE